MEYDMRKKNLDWIKINGIEINNVALDFFDNRNLLQDELTKMTNNFLQEKIIPEEKAYIVSAIIGEIGNNSFDHNIGNWPNIRGIVFGYNFDNENLQIIIADNGQGVLKTLKSVRPKLDNDQQALKVAFTEIVSGRAPEARGNGLKFVKQNVESDNMQLIFVSGDTKVLIDNEIKFKKVKNKFQGCLAILKVKR